MPRQDPRLQDAVGDSVNAKLQDRAVSHLLFLTRLETHEANQVVSFLNRDVVPDLLDQLARRMARIEERGFDIGPRSTERLRDMISALGIITQDGIGQARKRVQDRMLDLAKSDAQWQVGAIKQALPVNLEMVIPSVPTLRAAIMQRPFDGMPLTKWFDGLGRQTRVNLERAIRQGIIEGETVDQIVRRVRGTRAAGFTDGVMRTTTRHAETITRSAVIHSSNQARQVTYEENAGLIQAVQWVSTLDSRTCVECAGLDGTTFPVSEGRRPPAHARCRCTTVPVLKSWQDMGIDADEMPAGTRASMDGQVPEDLTYNQWLRRKVNAGEMDIVVEALGEKRAKLFAAGGLDVQQFTAGTGRTLTLKQLRAKEASAFEAAGVAL